MQNRVDLSHVESCDKGEFASDEQVINVILVKKHISKCPLTLLVVSSTKFKFKRFNAQNRVSAKKGGRKIEK